MNKSIIALSLLLLFGCAETPNTETTRHQIDDLRDQDGDGIINQRDRCLDTPAGTIVDNEGCAEWKFSNEPVVVTVNFDYDKSVIRPDQEPTVNKLARMLEETPDANVVLIGDTSSEGTNDYNRALAKRRTAAIKVAIENLGIESQRISEQEFTEVTQYTEQLKQRKRRTIAVFYHPEMSTVKEWDIFTSEKDLTSSTKVEAPSE
ncbi:OmpA family protein [Vibrio maritimus]|uniref:OmpA family protein n=1 Tax=Vibrio maritimus TaxID=990268 RepID=UPI004068A200